MNYTIAIMEDCHGEQTLKLNKDGSKYLVCHYNTETGKYTSKTFGSIEEAERAFFKIASCFIHGTYSAEDRAKMLLEG